MMGTSLAWIFAASENPDQYPNQKAHIAMMASASLPTEKPHLCYDVRTVLRAWGEAQDALSPVFELERPPRPGEPQEPPGLA